MKYRIKTTQYNDIFQLERKIGPFWIYKTSFSCNNRNLDQIIKKAERRLDEYYGKGKIITEFVYEVKEYNERD